MIRKVRGKKLWVVVSSKKDKNGKRKVLSKPYRSRKKAAKRLQQIEFFKHQS